MSRELDPTGVRSRSAKASDGSSTSKLNSRLRPRSLLDERRLLSKFGHFAAAEGWMTKLESLRNCFVETFALDATTNPETLRYQGIQNWDSVGHMQLVAAIETTFDVMFETQEVLDMSSFGKLLLTPAASARPTARRFPA